MIASVNDSFSRGSDWSRIRIVIDSRRSLRLVSCWRFPALVVVFRHACLRFKLTHYQPWASR